jgi:hypothetical protein
MAKFRRFLPFSHLFPFLISALLKFIGARTARKQQNDVGALEGFHKKMDNAIASFSISHLRFKKIPLSILFLLCQIYLEKKLSECFFIFFSQQNHSTFTLQKCCKKRKSVY